MAMLLATLSKKGNKITKKPTNTGKGNTLPKITKANYASILKNVASKSELKGEPFDAAESELTEKEVEELFRGKKTVRMCIRIAETNYAKLDLSSVQKIIVSGCKNKGEDIPALVVEDNQLLKKFFLSPKLVVEYGSGNLPMMRIQRNRDLENIDMLKYAFKNKNALILEDGECHITKELTTFNGITNCKIISGNITISSSIENPPANFRLQKISGCLRIDGTNITNIDFLSDVTYGQVTCTRGKHDSACRARPITSETISSFQNCKKILGNLEIIGWPEDVSQLQQAFGNVEEIHGQLLITNTSIKSTADIFKSLRVVENHGPTGRAVIIKDNSNLELIQIDSLESIHSDQKTAVIIQQPKAIITSKTSYRLRVSTSGKVELKAMVSNPDEGGMVPYFVSNTLNV
ncbi:unnamed protein product [Cylicocyclus nassatus]|uniref:Receptor L-domain domain-containing protein n=1 Tax=Cylicocyclus nassatus TaxID=53992 RepID=A0AA36GUW0_CYLNA|nr:unnamed protein product [Cylicocyclus nassatus]